jgi:hypothetical protein
MTADQVLDVSQAAILAILVGGVLLAFRLTAKRTRERTMQRKEMIATWRRELLPSGQESINLPTASGEFSFMRSPAYASLRPHLSKGFRDRLEAERQIIQFIIEDGRIIGVVGDYPYKQLGEEIARVEREWNLM